MYVCIQMTLKNYFFPLITFHVARICTYFEALKYSAQYWTAALLISTLMLFPYMKNICHVTTNLDLSMMQTIFWDSFWRISTINKRKLFSYQITDANAFFDSLLILICLIRFSATRTQTNCYVCHKQRWI